MIKRLYQKCKKKGEVFFIFKNLNFFKRGLFSKWILISALSSSLLSCQKLTEWIKGKEQKSEQTKKTIEKTPKSGSEMNQIFDYKKEGKEFLRKKKEESGIQSLDSGLLYRVIREGSGKKPMLSDTVEVNYEGKLTNGKIFDSSYARNSSISFRLTQVIQGWQEGLQLMKEGSEYEFFIPSELAYGKQELPSIPADSVLIFKVELIKVVKN